MHYMLLIYSDPADAPDVASPEGQAQFAAWGTVTQEIAESGTLIHGSALQGVEAATTVRQRDGETLHVDGPFAETKELLGGYYLIDVPDLDAALAWAAKMPNVHYGSVEVRPLMSYE